MCVYSMIVDHYYDKWKPYVPLPGPDIVPLPYTPSIPTLPAPSPKIPTQAEIDEFYKLLERARQYDREHQQPDCELEEKRQKLLKLAEELGVEIKFA